MAAGYDGSIRIDTRVDSTGMTKGVAAINKGVSGMAASLKKLGGLVASAFAVGALVRFGKESVMLASDIQEVQNVIDVTFGQGAEQVEAFAKTAQTAYGLSELAAKRYTGTLGAMLKSTGFASDAALSMSTALAALAGDMASFYNLDTDEAFDKIRAGISGEIEPLRQLGINMSVANLEAFALAQGITKSYSAMSQAQQTLLRYQYLMQTTADAQGDFARTSGSFANQLRLLQLNFDQLKIAVGNAILPIAQAVLPAINAIIAGLTRLANVFAQVSSLLFGQKSAPQVGANQQIASSADKAADATEGLASATGDVGDAAKKAAKDMKGMLAGFDELNILADSASGSLDGVSGEWDAGGLDMGLTTVPGGEIWADMTVNPALAEQLEGLKTRFLELKDLFLQGFEFGLGDVDFSALRTELQSIGETLRGIFTDVDVVSAANGLMNSFAYALGTAAGAVTSVGVTIATALVGGAEQFLAENETRIKDWLVRIFDARAEIYDIIAEFSAAFANIFSVFSGEEAQGIVASVVQVFADIFGGIVEVGTKAGRDILDALTAPFIEHQDQIQEALQGLLAFFDEIFSAIADTVRAAVDSIVALYDEHIAPFIQTVKAAFTEWFQHLLDGWQTYIQPVLDNFAAKLNEVVQEHVIPMVEKIVEYFSKVFDSLKTLWDTLLKPLVSWVIDNLVPLFSSSLEMLGEHFNTFLTLVSDVVGGIFEVLGGIIEFLTGVFTGDWTKAWNGIESIFSGVWNGIVGALESAVNFIINGINGLISALNKIHFELPDWVPLVGGRSFGIDIPKIPQLSLPRLASGAVIPPGRQFAAILGDQRSGTNIEAPLATIEQALENVMRRMGNAGGDINITVESKLDGRVIARNTVRHINQMTRSAGQPVLL